MREHVYLHDLKGVQEAMELALPTDWPLGVIKHGTEVRGLICKSDYMDLGSARKILAVSATLNKPRYKGGKIGKGN